jgi:signal transduction histidine kinase
VSHPTIEQLAPIDLFEGLSEAELQPWADAAELRTVAPGDAVSVQGEAFTAFHLLLEGRLHAIATDAAGRAEPVTEHVAPTWIGAIGVLTGGVAGVSLQALSECTLAAIEAERFVQLTLTSRRVFERVMRQVRPVVGRITAIEQNRERLASLGTMAAGLAHELNNPAAAARRAASDLAEALDVLSSTIGQFVESGMERSEAEQLVALQRAAVAGHRERSPLHALDAADAEDEMLAALEKLGVPEAWRLAEPLAAAGVDEDWLAQVAALAGPATASALQWVAASLTTQELAAELIDSTGRISGLVGAVKAYAYMDRGELVEVDVHEGLETTLAVMAHKLKHTAIEVVRDYEKTLPKLTVHGGELNQVWTNLLDNAICALGERGTITIATTSDGSRVRVDIGDDGPGIDPAVRERIFEPFFTTKDVGQGTGLGLDTARRIVVERHHGSIDVDSEPGRTVFRVWLPIEQQLGAAAGNTSKLQEEAA